MPRLLESEQKLNRADTCRQTKELLARYGDEFWQPLKKRGFFISNPRPKVNQRNGVNPEKYLHLKRLQFSLLER
ncbi:hypothetical protein Trydic_g21846 [Trypoxylus dichotomus]